MNAQDIASKAADLVAGDRDRQHGAKKRNFDNIAAVWNGYLAARREPADPLDAIDVGHMMVLMKIARTQAGDVNLDDYIDAAGYAACAGEIATGETFNAWGQFDRPLQVGDRVFDIKMCSDRTEREWYATVLAVRGHKVLVRYDDQSVDDDGCWWPASDYERVE